MHPVYRDTQRTKPWWVWGLVLGLGALAWATFVAQVGMGREVGPRPAPDWGVWLVAGVIGVGLPALVASLRLTFEVDDRELRCRFRPLMRRRVPLDRIASAEVRDYRPILEYGGWGIRWAPRRGWVYSLSGDRGVQLVLTDGRRLLLGTDRPEQLSRAINVRRGGSAPS